LGVSRSAASLGAPLGHRFNDRIAAAAGYRHPSVEYENDGFVRHVSMHGPIIGLRIQSSANEATAQHSAYGVGLDHGRHRLPEQRRCK
jgi:hypothetical protein